MFHLFHCPDIWGKTHPVPGNINHTPRCCLCLFLACTARQTDRQTDMLHILLFVTDITGQALSDCSVITLTNTELDTRLLRHQDQFIKYIDTTRKKVHASIHLANLTKQTPMSFWYSFLIHLPCTGPLYPYIYHSLVLDVPTSVMLWSFMSLHLSYTL